VSERTSRREERCKEGPVLGGELHLSVAELPLQDGDLVAQGQDLHVLVPVAHRQQAQRGEGVGDREIGKSKQHE
jgi:hypothetical protein